MISPTKSIIPGSIVLSQSRGIEMDEDNRDDLNCFEVKQGRKSFESESIVWGMGEVLNEIFLSGNMPHFHKYACSKSVDSVGFVGLYVPNLLLRGISQVFLCNHPLSGLLICGGLAVTSVELMCHALLGAAIGALGKSLHMFIEYA